MVMLQALVMAEMASMYVFSKAMPVVSSIVCGCCVATYTGYHFGFRHHLHNLAYSWPAGGDPSFGARSMVSRLAHHGTTILSFLWFPAGVV